MKCQVSGAALTGNRCFISEIKSQMKIKTRKKIRGKIQIKRKTQYDATD